MASVPEIWGFAEVVEFLGVSQQRATVLTNRHDFPTPIQELASGRIWLADAVREWQRRRRERYPGPEESDEL
jgi:predicted DNA-binding transcriptional regulator AlpA